MDPFYFIAIVVTTYLFFGFPTLVIWMLYRFLKKKTTQQNALIITGFSSLLFVCFVFLEFYPSNSFYFNDYEKNTELELPISAKLIDKKGTNSIYNFGDYNISYTIKLTSSDFDLIQNALLEKGFKEHKMHLETTENDFLLLPFQDSRIDKILVKDYGFKNYEVLFMDDKKTVICNSNKW